MVEKMCSSIQLDPKNGHRFIPFFEAFEKFVLTELLFLVDLVGLSRRVTASLKSNGTVNLCLLLSLARRCNLVFP